jgi:hypothetical protein
MLSSNAAEIVVYANGTVLEVSFPQPYVQGVRHLFIVSFRPTRLPS